jgi:GDP-L-fucose synthase
MKILVTGSNGLVGFSIKKKLNSNDSLNVYYSNSKDCDLRNENKVSELFEKVKPEVVIHCASLVGGVYENMNNNFKFLVENARLNLNIIDNCNKYNVKKCILILSTCIFPDKSVKYPLTSNQLHNGLPHFSNIGYAYSKRLLSIAGSILSENSNTKVIQLIPTNLYGENDNYNINQAHVIPALIHKIHKAEQENKDLELYGSGNAIRQFLYVDDLAEIIEHFSIVDYDEKDIMCITSCPEKDEISILELAKLIAKIYNFKGEIKPNKDYNDGQYKKTTSDSDVMKYMPSFKFTSLEKGLKQTISYFKENYDKIRK